MPHEPGPSFPLNNFQGTSSQINRSPAVSHTFTNQSTQTTMYTGYPLNHCCQKSNYKRVVTGGNDPTISCKMQYASFVKHNKLFSRYPISCSKQANTGISNPPKNPYVKYIHTKKGVLLTKLFCSQTM
jgi:hypothetical protein